MHPPKRSTARTEEAIAAVKRSFEKDPNQSIRHRAKELNMIPSTVWKILRDDLHHVHEKPKKKAAVKRTISTRQLRENSEANNEKKDATEEEEISEEKPRRKVSPAKATARGKKRGLSPSKASTELSMNGAVINGDDLKTETLNGTENDTSSKKRRGVGGKTARGTKAAVKQPPSEGDDDESTETRDDVSTEEVDEAEDETSPKGKRSVNGRTAKAKKGAAKRSSPVEDDDQSTDTKDDINTEKVNGAEDKTSPNKRRGAGGKTARVTKGAAKELPSEEDDDRSASPKKSRGGKTTSVTKAAAKELPSEEDDDQSTETKDDINTEKVDEAEDETGPKGKRTVNGRTAKATKSATKRSSPVEDDDDQSTDTKDDISTEKVNGAEDKTSPNKRRGAGGKTARVTKGAAKELPSEEDDDRSASPKKSRGGKTTSVTKAAAKELPPVEDDDLSTEDDINTEKVDEAEDETSPKGKRSVNGRAAKATKSATKRSSPVEDDDQSIETNDDINTEILNEVEGEISAKKRRGNGGKTARGTKAAAKQEDDDQSTETKGEKKRASSRSSRQSANANAATVNG